MIIIIMNLLHINFFLVCNIIMWEEICQYYLVMRYACLIFRSKLSSNFLVVMTLGVRVVLFSSEGAEVSETEYLSCLLSTISSGL